MEVGGEEVGFVFIVADFFDSIGVELRDIAKGKAILIV